jgi:hypothetical protein
MFFVSDTQQRRHGAIRGFLREETATIGLILAAVDFEWTVRRAILALGVSPTKEIKHKFSESRVAGPDGYKRLWKEEPNRYTGRPITSVVKQWSKLVEKPNGAFALRNRIVHGIIGSSGLDYVNSRAEVFLEAAVDLEKEANAYNCSVYQVIRRIKPRAC